MAATIDINLIRGVVERLPGVQRTLEQNTNAASFHVIKLPTPRNLDRFRRIIAEFCIQPMGTSASQTIWWTCYIVLARRGALTTGTGVYSQWSEFGQLIGTEFVEPRTDEIAIIHSDKGVLVGNRTAHVVHADVDLSAARNLDVYAVLLSAGMHDGAYRIPGQARLEYSTRE